MHPRSKETEQIKEGLKKRIEALCARLLKDGKRHGRLWVAHNPITGDYAQSREFKVALTRDVGAWKDYRTGEKGDVIGLIAYLNATDFRGAMDWARDFLGLRQMSREERDRFARDTQKAMADAARISEEKRLQRIKWANDLFMSADAYGSGTAAEAHALAYFAGRKIPLDDIPNLAADTFRFHPSLEFWPRATYRNEGGRSVKVQAGPRFPCILSAMRTPTGQVTGVHHTFLDPVRPVKLAVAANENAKMMRFECAGAMIWVSHGPENLPVWEARQPHPAIFGEGIEDALSQARANGDMARAAAVGSLSMLSGAPLNLPCIEWALICQDNDWAKPQAQKQFADEMAKLESFGKPVVAKKSHIGKDFNDLMQGEE
ncbi:hypothetical protein GOZ80_14185 [Agrobacterium vitis]|uniref:DUF7146 domain-containing protein n=1 Tax=Agrobacterium vitis TaxID=373 RepID=UPI0008DC1D4F|nr:hypothetical protein [Agrobacterium vitis]MUO96625.1 hypothetical protein [Agrobacterium vitis]MVA93156.1 hypothetical protein [Agrobacterium vitis]MVB03997.1 hypothetical protein [Agrobacterium vitis]